MEYDGFPRPGQVAPLQGAEEGFDVMNFIMGVAGVGFLARGLQGIMNMFRPEGNEFNFANTMQNLFGIDQKGQSVAMAPAAEMAPPKLNPPSMGG